MRIFKTKWFNREAKSHAIKDDELSEAIKAVLQGKRIISAAEFIKNVSIRTGIVQSFWRKVENTGFTPSFTPSRIWQISAIENWRGFVS